MSAGEIQRALERHDKALMNAVTTDAWARENDRVKERFAETKERIDDVEETAMSAIQRIETGKQNVWSRTLQIAGIAVAIVAAYIAAKGIK
jgi:hypothetical protein